MAMNTSKASSAQIPNQTRYLLVAAVVVLAFFASYQIARGLGGASNGVAGGSNAYAGGALGNAGTGATGAAGGGCNMSGGTGAAGAAGAGGGGCCGGGGPAVEGATTVEGSVQKIAVDTSAGSFNPNVIKAKAGVPIEIAFSQSPGGCLSGVLFPDFNINEDLTGGPKTVQLPALDKGEYTFYCQMQMVSAKIVVE